MTLPSSLSTAALLLMLCTAAAEAQAVHGTLRDADRARPLPAARLLLLDDEGGAVDSTRSDRTGHFRFTAPAAGTYSIHFRMDGWASVSSDAFTLSAGEDRRFNFDVPLISVAAVNSMSDIIRSDGRLQESLRDICGEPFRAWEAGLLVGVVRERAGNEPVAGARVSVATGAGDVARATVTGDNGVYVLCNLPVGSAVPIRAETPQGTVELTDVEIRAGTASWYDLHVGPRRRQR